MKVVDIPQAMKVVYNLAGIKFEIFSALGFKSNSNREASKIELHSIRALETMSEREKSNT